ncbi:MAG: HlyD family efflux transporter periplasmic adaptor subunit, partial [Leptolyngbyaceae bacterium]|nr:HlyD family efflux transporter periplasmic adaptor subunit [Leptolyngbyaceae bacterium]
RQQVIQSAAEGRVDQVFVAVGDRVTPGQPLLLLQDDTWETKQLDHDLEMQQQEVDMMLQQQAIATAEVNLEDAKATLSEDEALFDQGYIARDSLEESRRGVREAETLLQNERLKLQQTTLALQRLQLAAQTLEQEQRDKQVLAPEQAIILDVLVQRGSVVEIGTDLMVLGDPSRELVYLQLPPLRAQQVQPLQPARIQPIGPEAVTYPGTVLNVARLAGSGEDSEQTSLSVVVELDTPSRTLIPGTQVSVDIIPEQRIDVVKVEAGAVQQGEDGFFVWILGTANTAQKQPITVGLEGLTEVEVVQGLAEGDRVIVRPEQPLSEGMTVEVREN